MRARLLTPRLRVWAPRVAIILGIVKAIGVLGLAPLVGAPWWLAIGAAALWVAGPIAAAAWWNRRGPGAPQALPEPV